MTYRLVKKADVPVDAVIAPWPVTSNPPKPRAKPAGDERRPISRTAVAMPRPGFVSKRRRFTSAEEEESVPPIMAVPVTDHDGKTLRGPLVQSATWWDPEDTTNRASKSRRMVHGMKRIDPVQRLSWKNALFQDEHIKAADIYRYVWELGPGSDLPGWRTGEPSGGGFGPSIGPSDVRLLRYRKWLRVQEYLGDHKSKDAMEHIVLNRGHVKSWSQRVGMSEKAATGYFFCVLERLVLYFKDEVEKLMRVDELEVA
jgi:hypothetical protein